MHVLAAPFSGKSFNPKNQPKRLTIVKPCLKDLRTPSSALPTLIEADEEMTDAGSPSFLGDASVEVIRQFRDQITSSGSSNTSSPVVADIGADSDKTRSSSFNEWTSFSDALPRGRNKKVKMSSSYSSISDITNNINNPASSKTSPFPRLQTPPLSPKRSPKTAAPLPVDIAIRKYPTSFLEKSRHSEKMYMQANPIDVRYMEMRAQPWDIVNPLSRKRVIMDVMIRIAKLRGWERSTVFAAVYYMDRYLSAVNIDSDEDGSQGNLILLGFTCFFVAKKVHEEGNHISLRNMLKYIHIRSITITDVKVKWHTE